MLKKPLHIALFLILLATFFYLTTGNQWFEKKATKSSKNNIPSDVSLYKNKDGRQWSIPKGDYDFMITSGMKKYPKFLSGKVDPTDVQVGDTQKMEIVVADSVPVTSAVARIQTDNGVKAVPLKLVSSKVLSDDYFKNQKYLVDGNDRLVINDGKNAITDLVDSLVKKARAQALVQYTFQGKWIVSDTHRETYRTTFVATNKNGDSNSYVIAWSDPCLFDVNGTLGGNCTYATGVDGVDGLNMNLGTYSINLTGSSAVLGFNNGKSITIGSGSIGSSANPITGGAKVLQTDLYYTDNDGDWYAPSIAMRTTCGAGTIRVKDSLTTNYSGVTTNLDCYDSNANVHPGQSSYFYTPSGQLGSNDYDYDCSGTISKGFGKAGAPSVKYTELYTQNSNLYCAITGMPIYPSSYNCGTQITPIDPNYYWYTSAGVCANNTSPGLQGTIYDVCK